MRKDISSRPKKQKWVFTLVIVLCLLVIGGGVLSWWLFFYQYSPLRANSHSTCEISSYMKMMAAQGQNNVYIKRGAIVYKFDAQNGSVLWQHQVHTNQQDTIHLEANNGSLYVLYNDGVEALNENNGQEVWHVALTSPIVVSDNLYPQIADGTIYLLHTDGSLSALNAQNGSVKWNSSLKGGQSFLLGDGAIYAETNQGQFYSLDAATGKENWHLGLDAATAVPQGTPMPFCVSPDDGGIIYGVAGSTLYAIHASDGQIYWKQQDEAGAAYSTLQVVNGIVFVGSGPSTTNTNMNENVSSTIKAYRAGTGELLWTAANGYQPQFRPTIYNGILFASYQGRSVSALSVDTGKPLWHITDGCSSEGCNFEILGLNGNTLYLGSRMGSPGTAENVMVYDLQTGKKIKQDTLPLKFSLPSSTLSSSLSNNTAFLLMVSTVGGANLSTDDKLVAVNLTDGNMIWQKQLDKQNSNSIMARYSTVVLAP